MSYRDGTPSGAVTFSCNNSMAYNSTSRRYSGNSSGTTSSNSITPPKYSPSNCRSNLKLPSYIPSRKPLLSSPTRSTSSFSDGESVGSTRSNNILNNKYSTSPSPVSSTSSSSLNNKKDADISISEFYEKYSPNNYKPNSDSNSIISNGYNQYSHSLNFLHNHNHYTNSKSCSSNALAELHSSSNNSESTSTSSSSSYNSAFIDKRPNDYNNQHYHRNSRRNKPIDNTLFANHDLIDSALAPSEVKNNDKSDISNDDDDSLLNTDDKNNNDYDIRGDDNEKINEEHDDINNINNSLSCNNLILGGDESQANTSFSSSSLSSVSSNDSNWNSFDSPTSDNTFNNLTCINPLVDIQIANVDNNTTAAASASQFASSNSPTKIINSKTPAYSYITNNKICCTNNFDNSQLLIIENNHQQHQLRYGTSQIGIIKNLMDSTIGENNYQSSSTSISSTTSSSSSASRDNENISSTPTSSSKHTTCVIICNEINPQLKQQQQQQDSSKNFSFFDVDLSNNTNGFINNSDDDTKKVFYNDNITVTNRPTIGGGEGAGDPIKPSTSSKKSTFIHCFDDSTISPSPSSSSSEPVGVHQPNLRVYNNQIEESSTSRSRNRIQPSRDESNGLNGLKNIGNTCFMNSVIQCLSNTKPLLEYLLSDKYLNDINVSTSSMKGGLIKAFAQVINELWETSGEHVVNTVSLKSQIQRFAPRFMGYAQQDAQEFLRYLLEGLHEDVNRVTIKPQPILTDIPDHLSDSCKADESWKRYVRSEDSTIVDVFVGQLRSSLQCTSCDHVSVTLDPFWDLSLPIPARSGTVRLNQCLEHFTKVETLDGDEKPTCSKCQTRRKCTKRFSIQKFPKILVIHLKRFSPTERFRAKLSVLVDFPLNGLDLSAFAAPGVQGCTYNLYGVANHSGTLYSGHYTAYCKHPYSGEWHEYNDNRVSSVCPGSIVSSEAYVLFYEQQQQQTLSHHL